MKGSSLGVMALAASLTTGSALAQKSISQMTKDEIHAEVISLCMDEKRMSNIIDPDKVCEYSLDNGKTWKEYIPSLPNLPNGTAGFAGVLLALIAAGAAIIRFRKKDEYIISPDLRKKYVSSEKPKNEPENTPLTTTESMLAQVIGVIPESKGGDIVIQQENTGIDILSDGNGEKNTEIPLLTEVTTNEIIEEGSAMPIGVVQNIEDAAIVIKPSVNTLSPLKNNMLQHTVLEMLQGGTLDRESKVKLNDSLPQINPYRRIYLPQKNVVGRYGFNISEDENGTISINKDKQTACIYSLDIAGKIQETEEYTISGVKAVQVIEDGYLQFIIGNDFEKKVILLSKESI